MLFLKRKTGSAILIVMLLITVLSSVALTVGYLAMAEVMMETNSQDGMVAYYAAEAGIEDGLLRFRYDNNVQVGSFITGAERVERVDIDETDGSVARQPIVNPANSPGDSLRQTYDLRIKYKSINEEAISPDMDHFVNTELNNDETEKLLKKDESLNVLGFDVNSRLYIKFVRDADDTDPICSIDPTKCFIQIRGTNIGTEFIPYSQSDQSATSYVINAGSSVLIKSWGMDVRYGIAAERISDSSVISLDEGITTIEATGYYGSAKRRLQATIDRKTGKLLEIFDFTLNSQTGNIQ